MKQAAALLLLLAAPILSAQTAHDDLKAVQDNSFLLEEAYNQEPFVVQHLGVFVQDGDTWELAFTQEWPLGAQAHQLSYDIPILDSELGDVMINYRYQLVGNGDTDLAIAPRFSVIVPTADDSEAGVEVGLPISRVLTPRLISHTNIDVTFQDGTEIGLGQSFIYALSSRTHLMLESVYAKPDEGEATFLISPGFRRAINRPSGWQIVPGVAVPIGVGPTAGENAVLLYLSFEK